ncbi:MAG TPA: trypsin-like peptidase domain-containing protein [Verrucomicrobiae bacterium]|nr:trypsin-like peptidase domain-containing protein [Verrucomicrobiae bacterium]
MAFPLQLALALFTYSISPAQTNRSNFDLVRQLNEAFVRVAETVSPAVVVISVTEKPPQFSRLDDVQGMPPKRNERQSQDPFDEPMEGRGSGMIIRKNGYILTNGHVVRDADAITVRLFDGREFSAQVRGIDEISDVAILKIEAGDLPVVRLGDSTRVRVGEFAIAIGAPFRLDYSVTVGHISAKSRSQVVPSFLNTQIMDQDFLQTDANINPGNSGGPLVNIEGEVIGVNTLVRGMSIGIGFAIPINLAKEIGEQLILEGRFVRPWLGVEIKSLSDEPELRRTLTNITHGVVVVAVVPESPAAKSDLRENDVIATIDGDPVVTAQQLRNLVRAKTIGQTVSLGIWRNREKLSVSVETARYDPPGQPSKPASTQDSQTPR